MKKKEGNECPCIQDFEAEKVEFKVAKRKGWPRRGSGTVY